MIPKWLSHEPNAIKYKWCQISSFKKYILCNIFKPAQYNTTSVIHLVPNLMFPSDAKKFIRAFVFAALYYCTELLPSLPRSYITNLQHIQNAASHMSMMDRIMPALKSLHRLLIAFRIGFKTLLLAI